MNFENLRLQQITLILRYNTHKKRWIAKNRDTHIIGIKTDGAAFHDFGYKKFDLSKNDLFFFNRRDDYSVNNYNPGESFCIHFTTYEDISTESFCISLNNTEELNGLIQKAYTLKTRQGNDDLALVSTFYKICDVIFGKYRKTYAPKDSRIINAKNFIDVNFSAQDCLDAAVKESGISARRFNDIFKNNFDITPNKYIVLKKVEYAKSLLKTKNLSITEIAELCGFSDVYYFSKVFKQVCGVSPREWVNDAL